MGTTILLGIVSVGILIFIHELGHFISAQLNGIRVEVFSIGWGRGILSFNWRGTKIQVGWIPFGGYCKMAGDSPRDQITGNRNEYYSSSPLRRIVVALSGPLFNYVFAVILFALIFIIGYVIQTYPNKIILAESESVNIGVKTPAQRAGLRDGDIIERIDGERVDNWDDITERIVRNALKPLELEVLRDEKTLYFVVIPELEKETGRGLIGIHPWVEPVVGGIIPGEAADLAGLRAGDRIVSVDGRDIINQIEFFNAITDRSGQKVKVTFLREGEKKELYLTPQKIEGYDSAGIIFKQITYRIEGLSPHIALGKGFLKSIQGIRDTIRGIGFLFSGKVKAKNAVAGPAKIIYISGVIAKEGFIYFLQVLSYISIAFFIMNLIPFPALDGSHIVISLYEVVTRKKPNLEVIYKIQAFGFIFLIVALIFITMNDISSFFGK